MTWYRVHFRKKSIIVEGEAELERVKARKVPKVVLVETCVEHECSTCGKVEAWLDSWSWFGSYQDLEDNKPILKFCSSPCRKQHELAPDDFDYHTGKRRQRWKPEKGDSWRPLHEARAAANPRLFPKPEWPPEQTGNGWCRWCGKAVDPKSGRRTWHERCLNEFWLHTDLTAQTRFLMKRDGPACAHCGDLGHWIDAGDLNPWRRPSDESRGNLIKWSMELQVDHVVALWKVLHLPDVQRRAFFGPVNLWLLCGPCHKAKTAIEAAERARGEIWQPDP